MNPPYHRYARVERLEAPLDPPEPRYECVCPGGDCCGCDGERGNCSCPYPEDLVDDEGGA